MADELIFTGDQPSSTLARLARAGSIRRLAQGIYTSDLRSPEDRVLRRNWQRILARLYPKGVVVTDRSATTPQPVQPDGSIYVAVPGVKQPRTLSFPGLRVIPRPGAGPIDGDAPLVPGRVWLAGQGRAMVENLIPSRARTRQTPRTLTVDEYELWLDRLAHDMTRQHLLRLRGDVERSARALGLGERGAEASALVGVLLGTRKATLQTSTLRRRVAGRPHDRTRTALFDRLISTLQQRAPKPILSNPDGDRVRYLPFWEAYFSNYIEGTEFTVEEAEEIVFEHAKPDNRTADSHDVFATYEIITGRSKGHVAQNSTEFVTLLQERHAHLLAARPEKHPGQFKERDNQAGGTVFVMPNEVQGTLEEGWERAQALTDAFSRAVYLSFVVTEVHPFDDGNGRLSRIMMNAELETQSQSRIIIPTFYRDNYLSGLEALSSAGQPNPYIDILAFAQRYTSEIDFAGLEHSRHILTATNAFREPRLASQYEFRLPSALPLDTDTDTEQPAAPAETSRGIAQAADRSSP